MLCMFFLSGKLHEELKCKLAISPMQVWVLPVDLPGHQGASSSEEGHHHHSDGTILTAECSGTNMLK